MWFTVAHFFGARNNDGNSAGYLFWSGVGSDLAYLGAAYAFLRGRNCEVHGCWRIGRHTTAAGQRACRKHNPEGRVTAQSMRERHHLYIGKQPGKG